MNNLHLNLSKKHKISEMELQEAITNVKHDLGKSGGYQVVQAIVDLLDNGDIQLQDNRKNFFSTEINMFRVTDFIMVTIQHLSLLEILKMIREIGYDMVRPESQLYHLERGYTSLNIEQANNLYNQLRSICDLFGQSIVNKREFNQEYLKGYEFAEPYINQITYLEEKLEDLKNVNQD